MRRLILGTAGHIDHGKTALVRALTGVDTDRLKEEKARGITIELGFAELEAAGGLRFGVVDVPGHEGFVRTMVAGATGMDVVLLVVAADEGVMPQTREHLSIVRLLGVERLAVALTKSDLVENEWLELVAEEVRELLREGPYGEAPIVATSCETGSGLEALREVLASLGAQAVGRDGSDVVRLPIDRVFTVRGTGTVITGTLWSGTIRKGQRVRVEPNGPEARVRALQVHGAEVGTVLPGSRTAVALVGPDVGRGGVERGQTLVTDWPASRMLTVRLSVLPGPGWQVEHNQRLRIHAGTAEVMARAVVPAGVVIPGGSEWVQLRLEAPVVARAGDRLIVRSYSPVTTIGGAVVAEPFPAKRSRFTAAEERAFSRLVEADASARTEACLSLAAWAGVKRSRLPVIAGLTPARAESETAALVTSGGVEAAGLLFGPAVVAEGERTLCDRVRAFHDDEPLALGVPLEILRQGLPRPAPPALAEVILRRLEAEGRLRVADGLAALPGFEVVLPPEAESARERLRDIYREAGVTPPTLKELPPELLSRPDLEAILGMLLGDGSLKVLDEGLYIWSDALDASVDRIIEHFGGRDGLTPSDFREVIPVTRKHLMPLLGFLDGEGVTVRTGDLRAVRGVPTGRG